MKTVLIPEDWYPMSFQTPYDGIRIEYRPASWNNIANGRWCINDSGFVWTREKLWEYEPQPSNRTEDFLTRARWDWEEIEAALAEGIKENSRWATRD
jgi:hypothetical protein